MELQKVAQERRSIRSYKEGSTIDNAVIEEIIDFTKNAPSWKNSQTPRYYAVTSAQMLAQVKEKCLPEFNAKNCENAPALIVTTFVKTRAGFTREGVAENELGDEWGAYDLGLANAYLILKAKELGLDSLIMGIRDGQALRQVLSIPDTQEVVAVIALGESDSDSVTQMPKRKNTEDILTIM